MQGQTILGVLTDEHAEDSDRVLAAELAGEEGVINDEFADALLAIVGNPGEPEELRGKAAISLGPALEHADTFGFEDADDLLISEATFSRIQKSLRDLFPEDVVPRDVRRRILEASVRAPQEWHNEAIRSAYSSEDGDWKLTAVFCMRFIRGFDEQIVEALNSEDADIHYEAVCAAGSWGVNAALSHVVALVSRGIRTRPYELPRLMLLPLSARWRHEIFSLISQSQKTRKSLRRSMKPLRLRVANRNGWILTRKMTKTKRNKVGTDCPMRLKGKTTKYFCKHIFLTACPMLAREIGSLG